MLKMERFFTTEVLLTAAALLCLFSTSFGQSKYYVSMQTAYDCTGTFYSAYIIHYIILLFLVTPCMVVNVSATMIM